MKLTIFFDGSFWCGLIEATDNETVKVVKYVFGAEPKAGEVLAFVNHTLPELLDATPSVKQKNQATKVKRINPKRLQRLVNQEKSDQSIQLKRKWLYKKLMRFKNKPKLNARKLTSKSSSPNVSSKNKLKSAKRKKDIE